MTSLLIIGPLGFATFCLVIYTLVGEYRGTLSLEKPRLHLVWSLIMLLSAATAITTDWLHVDGAMWHAFDVGTATFCIVLSIASFGRFRLLRSAESESIVTTTSSEETMVTWEVVDSGSGKPVDKVKIPETWGYPQNVYPIRHDLYKNHTFMATRQKGYNPRGRTG